MSRKNPDVDEYMEKLEPRRRDALAQLRSLIVTTAPDAIETMRYKMPTY
jgi:uncharacterized protein YdhG (YjbR/CyaY superfamily)